MRIFVGNVAFTATEPDIRKLFEGFGTVDSVLIATEKKKVKPRGFCFVEMPDDAQASAAIAGLNGTVFMERAIDVVVGREKPAPRPVTDYEYQKHNKPHSGGAARDQGYQRRSPYRAPARPHVSHPRDVESGTERAHAPERKSYARPSYGHGEHSASGVRKRTRGGPRPAWAKDRDQGRPWKKPDGQSRPWRKPEEGAGPRTQGGGEARPWRKPEGASRPWSKPSGEHRPWRKPGEHSSPHKKDGGESRPWRKPEGESRPWKKTSGEAKPWQKRSAGAKPWQKSGDRPQRSSFKGAKSPYKRRSSE